LIVKVLYFAAARDATSRKGEELEVEEGATVSRLAAEILRAHPSMKPLRSAVRFSVNLEVAGEDTKLKEGDEVGVLPPVAGG
jgi:molybdopterin converting factor subunit 1